MDFLVLLAALFVVGLIALVWWVVRGDKRLEAAREKSIRKANRRKR